MRLAMIVEYDGTDYSGFQFQKNAPSVQEQIEKAIRSLTAETVRVKAAGRTDAGVHAHGQVVAFDTSAAYSTDTVRSALNALLPPDISVRSVYRVSGDFDPRRDATSRLYRYTLLKSEVRSAVCRRTVHTVRGPLDTDTMREAASLMVGTHNFANFGSAARNVGASTVRRIDRVCLVQSGRFLRLYVEGNAFLTHQVRRMCGALLDLGSGKLTIEDIRAQVSGAAGAPQARSLPPQGLCLLRVKYAGFPPEEGE